MAGTFTVRVFVINEETNESGYETTTVRNDLMDGAYPPKDKKQDWAEQNVLKAFAQAYKNLVRPSD
jgi:hypothetical protein